MMTELTIATNNGDIGGGEVMLLNIADAARDLGVRVTVVAPSSPSALCLEAQHRGYHVVEIFAKDRISWMRGLRAWDASERRGILWCNGLVPATATAGHPRRVVHLHQIPSPKLAPALALARHRADLIVVPSHYMTAKIPGATVMANWTHAITTTPRSRTEGPIRVGFLGRFSPDKGLVILAEALSILDRDSPGTYRLQLAGGARFASRSGRQRVEHALTQIEHLLDRNGWMPPEAFFSAIDVAAFPSIWPESFGLVVSEAMSAGVPFVISDAGALPEVAGPDHPAIVPAGDSEGLAEAIRATVTAASPATVAAAKARWQQHFSPDAGRERLKEELLALGVLDKDGPPT